MNYGVMYQYSVVFYNEITTEEFIRIRDAIPAHGIKTEAFWAPHNGASSMFTRDPISDEDRLILKMKLDVGISLSEVHQGDYVK
jgi:hypothetical protein